MRNLSQLVKAYDIRGVVPDEFDEDLARQVGVAFTRITGSPSVVVAHDMRDSSPALAAAFTDGVTSEG